MSVFDPDEATKERVKRLATRWDEFHKEGVPTGKYSFLVAQEEAWLKFKRDWDEANTDPGVLGMPARSVKDWGKLFGDTDDWATQLRAVEADANTVRRWVNEMTAADYVPKSKDTKAAEAKTDPAAAAAEKKQQEEGKYSDLPRAPYEDLNRALSAGEKASKGDYSGALGDVVGDAPSNLAENVVTGVLETLWKIVKANPVPIAAAGAAYVLYRVVTK